MRVLLGHETSSHAPHSQPSADAEVWWDSKTAINGHVVMLGTTGTGKTHNIRNYVQQLTRNPNPPRIHLMDPHGDINIPGAHTIMFSEQTDYGLNPLVVNPDPDFGGVRKRVQSIIAMINRTSRVLGGKQEAVLRNILNDVYRQFGFDANNPATWSPRDGDEKPQVDEIRNRLYLDIPYSDREQAKDIIRNLGGSFDGDAKCWWIPIATYQGPITRWPQKTAGRRLPNLNDVLTLANQRYKSMYLGQNHDAIKALEDYQRAARTFNATLIKSRKQTHLSEELDKLQADLDRHGQNAIDRFTKYIEIAKSGTEVDDLLKYDSVDVLKSVVDRLSNLNGSGIFKSQLPPFHPSAPVWHYKLNALARDERKLFVLFKLEELFIRAMQRGEQKDVVEVVILDEGQTYMDDDPENPINIIAREARKFGIALVIASQSPEHFSVDFLSSVAVTMIIGLSKIHWDLAARKFRIDSALVENISPRHDMLAQVIESGKTRTQWKKVRCL